MCLLSSLKPTMEVIMLWLLRRKRNPGGISSCIRRCHFLLIGLLRIRYHTGCGVLCGFGGQTGTARFLNSGRWQDKTKFIDFV